MVKTQRYSFCFSLTLWRFHFCCQSFPAFIFFADYRSAGVMIHRGSPGGWSRYPKREWKVWRYTISVSLGEFARERWPEYIEEQPDPTDGYEPVRFVEGASIDLETLADDEMTLPEPPKGWRVYRRKSR